MALHPWYGSAALLKVTEIHERDTREESGRRPFVQLILANEVPMRAYFYLITLSLSVGILGCDNPNQSTAIFSEAAPSEFELHPDFHMELVASEPLVADPIDMEIDEYGNMYVVEMHGYPTDESGTDRVVLLRDSDGDGVMDERTVFADSLVLPMGVMRWKNGIIVTEPPNVIYFEDTDGDGRADIKKVMLTGFDDNDPESDVNNPTFGLDNWIYMANGPRSDSDIYFEDRPGGPRIPMELSNRNVRFHPDRYELEAQPSRSQYGIAFDTWGTQLLVNNRNHIYQEAIASRYLDRNPDLLVGNAMEANSDHGSAAEVFPITEDPNPQLLTDVGEITAACGITHYEAGLFPAGFENVSFVGEPAHNLVHVDRLTDDGPILVASRIRPHTEFLASTDSWFRPVNLYVGPDGALYVVDYYRQIIEGPEWLSDEVLASGDIYNGSDQGRIYRITPKGTTPAITLNDIRLGDATTAELVEKLADRNNWWRRNAQRLLLDRQDERAIPLLIRMVESSDAAVARLHALWTLQGFGGLRSDLIRTGLEDPVSGVRKNAIRLAELHLDDDPSLGDALIAMQTDPDPGVRYQLLLTLGFLDTPEAAAAREALLFMDIDNKWTQIAALSAPSSRESGLLARVIDRYEPEYASLVQRLAAMAGANRSAADIRRLLEEATRATTGQAWQAAVLQGLAEGFRNRDEPDLEAHRDLIVDAFFEHPSEEVKQASLDLLEVSGRPEGTDAATHTQNALDIADNRDLPAERRAQALEFITLGEPGRHVSFLKDVVAPDEPTDVQIAAVNALGAISGTTVSNYVVERWPVLTPRVRDAALTTFLTRPFQMERVVLLLEALESRTIEPASIDWPRRVTLMRDLPDDLKRRARAIFAAAEEQRQEKITGYVRTVLAADGRPNPGRQTFERYCVSCHRMGDIVEGSSFGPDMMSVRGWKPAGIAEHVVDPGKAIVQGYELWQIEMKSGETMQGIISTETANAVTLSQPGDVETTIPRQNIGAIQNLGISIMPSSYMDQISPQEMADLVAFLRTGR